MKLHLFAAVFSVLLPLRADDVLGKIGAIELTTAEAREAIAGLESSGDAPLAKDPAAISQYVRALLIQRLVIQQAEEKAFDKDPAVISRLVRARESALSEAFLQANSTPPTEYPSAQEIEEAYEAAKPSLLLPRAYRLAQIYTKEEATIRTAHKEASAKGADFQIIASTRSEEKASAANGGEIGWLNEDQIQQGIRDLLPQLKDGGISAPVKLGDGWHIVKRVETREPATATLEQVKPQLIVRLRADRARQLRSAFIAKLIKDHPLAINEIELSRILSAP
ncbi:MAG: peptidylprolyl isomerase [Akkermansiaceae bacterium]|nr:peptidylprolyl isomerase [Akkermansiaceae bacterium]